MAIRNRHDLIRTNYKFIKKKYIFYKSHTGNGNGTNKKKLLKHFERS